MNLLEKLGLLVFIIYSSRKFAEVGDPLFNKISLTISAVAFLFGASIFSYQKKGGVINGQGRSKTRIKGRG